MSRNLARVRTPNLRHSRRERTLHASVNSTEKSLFVASKNEKTAENVNNFL